MKKKCSLSWLTLLHSFIFFVHCGPEYGGRHLHTFGAMHFPPCWQGSLHTAEMRHQIHSMSSAQHRIIFLFSPFSMITSLSDLARQPGIYLLLAFMWLKPLIPSPGSRRGFPFPAVPRALHSCSNGFFWLLFCIFSHLSSPRRSQPGSLRIRRCSSTLSSISLCGLSATSKLP